MQSNGHAAPSAAMEMQAFDAAALRQAIEEVRRMTLALRPHGSATLVADLKRGVARLSPLVRSAADVLERSQATTPGRTE